MRGNSNKGGVEGDIPIPASVESAETGRSTGIAAKEVRQEDHRRTERISEIAENGPPAELIFVTDLHARDLPWKCQDLYAEYRFFGTISEKGGTWGYACRFGIRGAYERFRKTRRSAPVVC